MDEKLLPWARILRKAQKVKMEYIREMTSNKKTGIGLMTTSTQDWYMELMHPMSSRMRYRTS